MPTMAFGYFFNVLGIVLPLSQVLGPLRLISRVPSMRDVVTVLIDTVPMLATILVIYLFVIHIFAVAGVQLWAGQLRNRCFLGEDISTKYNVSLNPYFKTKFDEKVPFVCTPDDKSGMQHCRDIPPYQENGETCSLAAPHNASAANWLVPTVASDTCENWHSFYNVCRASDNNPQRGVINFDNIFYAWITIFQVVTLEGWSEIMFFIMDVHNFWSFLFFMLVTIMGSFIIVNVCAVVIATQFLDKMNLKTEEPSPGTVNNALLCRWLACWLRRFIKSKKVQPKAGQIRTLSSILSPFKRHIATLVESARFDQLIMFAVFLSIVTIAVEHHNQPPEMTQVLHICNIVFTFVFFVEMMLKLVAHRFKYFFDLNNIFDFAIVIVSVWELISKSDGRLSVLRAFRLLRFVRLLHFLPYLKRQLLVLKRTIAEAGPLCLLLLFFTFVCSILGMHLFGGKFVFKDPQGDIIIERKNFDTLLWSMVTVFQILTHEDWNLVLYNAMTATSPYTFLYFFAIILLGKHVLLNILVGIVVQSFQAKGSSDSDQDSSFSGDDVSHSPTSLTSENDPSRSNQDLPPLTSEEDTAPANTQEGNKPLNCIQQMQHWCKEHEEWSFYLFSPQNRFRIFCQHVISHKMFDNMVLLFILLSCITIAMERPGIHSESTERWILHMSRYVFSGVFLVEMLFKVLALGVLFGKDSYCCSSWNVVDGLLVVLSVVHIIISLASTGQNNMLGILKVLRLLRTLRPLRVIKRAPKLKLAVDALITSIKPIGNIVFICCAFFFFYGILGVQLFKGKFYHCVGQDTKNITNKSDCLSANYLWEQKRFNFDSLPQALMSLFVMHSKDGWVNIMYDGLDAVGVDKQPVRNHNQWMLIFFITFMVMSFFLLDMFIGVMVETFHQCQQDQKKANEEEASQNLSRNTRRKVPQQPPYYTKFSPMRRSIHTLCTSDFLDVFMVFVILISVFIMAFQHYKQPLYIERLTEYSYYAFTLILIIEVLLKLWVFGLRRFLRNSWNVMDVVIVLVSVVSIVFIGMEMADTIPINPSILRVCRVLRLARVLKHKKIRVLLKTIIKTLSQVGSICLLFTFFFFIYAALGVELFGKLECTEDNPCLGLHRHVNFNHFGRALLTLYQVCTGDNWSGIMKDTLRECRPNDIGCVAYLSWVSPMFFSSFVVMAQFVLVNLVVAAIMQALEDSSENNPTNFCLPLEEEESLDTEGTVSPG
ncbi:voltage-dependent T-type calcium channel subunit alpha-1I-like [Eleginops maclovinus]|uniref:voltage-dependent T-type calcium channel subunit alpha-1I-like n=1 Tax=Eleginops maclovinus TaxID=56733 RepID=UPI00308086B3